MNLFGKLKEKFSGPPERRVQELCELAKEFYDGRDFDEAEKLLQQAAAITEGVADQRVKAWCLTVVATGWWETGHLEKGRDAYAAAYTISEQLGDAVGMAHCDRTIGAIDVELGNYEEGVSRLLRALERWRQLSDSNAIALSACALSRAAADRGDNSSAIRFAEESLTNARAVGRGDLTLQALAVLASSHLNGGEYDRGSDYAREYATATSKERSALGADSPTIYVAWADLALGNRQAANEGFGKALSKAMAAKEIGGAWTVANIALVFADWQLHDRAVAVMESIATDATGKDVLAGNEAVQGTRLAWTGQYEQALAALAIALPYYRSIGQKRIEASILNTIGDVSRETGDYYAATQSYWASLQIWQSLDLRWGVARSLEGISACLPSNHADEAALLFGAASEIRTTLKAPIEPVLQPRLDSLRASIEDDLGKQAATEKMQVGAEMPFDQVIRLAERLIDGTHQPESFLD